MFGVTLLSQACGLVAILLVWAVLGRGLDGRALWLGALAGISAGLGLAALYRALAIGTMSVVSPIVACGALLPFAISLATGERPSAAAVAGALAALAGAVLASVQESRAGAHRRRAMLLAGAAAGALGLFLYLAGLGA